MVWRWIAALLLLACAMAARADVVEELLQLPSAGDARLPVLLSRDDARAPTAVAVLFNGGGGAVGLLQRIPRPGANFLVRSRGLLAGRGVATAVIDVPTDLNTMSDAYRMGRRHADDVRTVAGALKQRFPGLPVFLVGTSRGTVSAAMPARRWAMRWRGWCSAQASSTPPAAVRASRASTGTRSERACSLCTTWTMPASPHRTPWHTAWPPAASWSACTAVMRRGPSPARPSAPMASSASRDRWWMPSWPGCAARCRQRMCRDRPCKPGPR